MPPIDTLSITDLRHSIQKSNEGVIPDPNALSITDKLKVYLHTHLHGLFEKFYAIERSHYHPSRHDQTISNEFNAHNQSLLTSFENELKDGFLHFYKRLALSVPFALLLIITSLWWITATGVGNQIHSVIAPFLILNCSLALLMACLWSWQPLANINNNFPGNMLAQVLNRLGGKFTLEKECPISVNNLTASNIIPPFTTETIDSYIIGNYGNVKIEILFSRLTPPLSEQTAPRQLTQNYLVATLTRDFTAKTILLSENTIPDTVEEELYRENRLAAGFGLANTPKTILPTNFEVWSSNAPKTKTLLTGNILSAVTNLFVRAERKKIKLSLYGDKLVANLPTLKPETNYSPFTPTKNIYAAIQQSLRDIKPVFDLITELESGSDNPTI